MEFMSLEGTLNSGMFLMNVDYMGYKTTHNLKWTVTEGI